MKLILICILAISALVFAGCSISANAESPPVAKQKTVKAEKSVNSVIPGDTAQPFTIYQSQAFYDPVQAEQAANSTAENVSFGLTNSAQRARIKFDYGAQIKRISPTGERLKQFDLPPNLCSS